MKCDRSIALAALLIVLPATGQELLRTFNLNPSDQVLVTTDLVVRQSGLKEFAYKPIFPKDVSSVAALDVSRGKPLPVRVDKGQAYVTLPSASSEKAELRLHIEEKIPATGLVLHSTLDKGRYVFILPAGYVLKSSSLPAQIETKEDHIVVGIVQGSDAPASLELAMQRGASDKTVPFRASLLALDNRIVSYQLLNPEDHRIRLWLEMYVDSPGQSHFYSQLRISDHVSDPVTLDVDRGIELPTRILSGKEATAIGDSPAPFPDDAQVLVADLGYSIPKNGSARLRSFQTATDPEGYQLTSPDEFRLDRFIARTRTQYILPAGWSLASMDQPGAVSTTPDGRVVIDFVGSSGQSSRLTIVGHRNGGAANP